MKAVEKYNARVDAADSLLCVGLDSDVRKLPAAFCKLDAPQLAFNRHIIDATAEYAAAFKFNMAFYEAQGADGVEFDYFVQGVRLGYADFQVERPIPQ